jgi:hypothetical protein
MRLLPPILANLFLVISAIGFGSLLHRLFPTTFSTLDRIALTLLGGLGILGTILFCVGQIWFSRPAIILILLLGTLLTIPSLASAARQFRSVMSQVSFPVLPTLVVSSVLLITAVGGLALPVGDMNDDAIAYHYHGPKVWLREGVIRPVEDEIQTAFPAVVEVQYAAVMSLGGSRAPGFFAVSSVIAALLIAASLSIRLGLNSSQAWWTAALIIATPAVYRGGFGGFLDLLFAAFILAAARVCFEAMEIRQYILFGLFCGIAMATKYHGLIAWALLVFCSFLVSVWVYQRRFGDVVKLVGVACLIALAVASPPYLRNWIHYGCPIYPAPLALLHFFTLKRGTLAAVQEVQRQLLEQGQGMGPGLVKFLLLPFNLTYHTADFRGGGGIGLAALALGPLGVIVSRRNPIAMGLASFSVLQLAAWFATAQISRYLIPVYLIAMIFAVLGWDYTARAGSRYAKALSCTAVAISIFFGLFMIVKDRREDVRAVVSSSFEAQRRLREIPRVSSFDYINREPSVRKVLILDSGIAAYFIDKPYIKPFGRWGERTLPGAMNVPQVMAQLSKLNASHVLAVRDSSGSFELPDDNKGLTLVFQTPDERIYRVD